MPALIDYSSIQTNLFVRLQIDEYRTSSAGAYTSQVLRFSDSRINYTINSEVYTGLGNLLGVTNSSSEIRPSSGELTITISGIPNTSIDEIVNSRIKGSPVTVYRAFFDVTTGTFINFGSEAYGRFFGFVNSYSLQEEYDIDARTATNTIILICNSSIDVLNNKTSGRRTNPNSEKSFYPNDLSMDRVPTLKNATFDFGAPK
jgi:hypothetical protein